MRASLFIPCLVDTLVPEVGEATAQVLSRLGVSLEYPQDQTCCGQPAYNSGYWDDARRVARQFLRAFDDSETIVSPSGSCVSMVRNHYQRLFADDPSELEKARAIGERTFELTEFLVNRLGVTDVGASFTGKATFHDSCHLNRELGIKDEPRALIQSVEGLELIEMQDSDRCCGFGGTFSVKFPELSAAMARRKVERIKESGADTVVMCDPGCLIQMRGYIHRQGVEVKAMHIVEVLSS
jgi:L-lactate dehydrogenase complex protein LldE